MPRPAEVIFASGANSGEVKDFPNLARGWGLTFDAVDAGGNGGFPPMEWFNFLLERIDSATQYFLQRGVGEWASTTLYAPGSIVARADLIFRALRQNSNVTPGTDPTTWSQLADATTATLLAPPGLIGLFSTPAVPAGWLKMNGASLSRTTFAALFGAIGTAFGSASSATFSLPDVRGEFPRFWDDGRGLDTGRVCGTVQAQLMLAHAHGGTALYVGDHAHAATAWTDTQGWHGHAVIDNGHLHPLGFGVISDQPGGNPPWASIGGNPSAWRYQTAPATANIGIAGDGWHAHNVGVSMAGAGGHAHSVVTDTQGGGENRPRNFSLMACIKY
jgi:microcystin-dependent protein